MPEKTPYDYHPEALSTYRDNSVLAALQNTDWFTPEFIIEVRENEPDPESDGLGPFKNKLLGDFLRFGFDRGELGPENAIIMSVITFLSQRMVGPQGHPFPLRVIPFADEEFMAFAKTLGADENYEVSRDMCWQIDPLTKCLIAPPSIKRMVVKQICSWGDDYEEVKRDTLLWAGLVKRGVRAYLERPRP